MAITTVDGVAAALANNNSRLVIDKASLANQVSGRYASMWRATGQPAQAAIPTSASIPTNALVGAMGFYNQTSPVESYIGWFWVVCSLSAMGVEVHDRVAHCGGLALNVATLQTVSGLDLSTLGLDADRRGDANYSDLQWWLEVYADGGATASNATVNVTYDDGSTGNLNVQAVGGTIRAGHMFALTPLIPVGKQGSFIRGVNSVTLSASTGTAGNFGFTCTRPRIVVNAGLANFPNVQDWAQTGLSRVPNDACLQLVVLPSTTSTGTLRGGGKIIHG